MVERITEQLAQKQNKLNKLNDLVEDVKKQIYQSNEKLSLKEIDELWIQAQERI